MSHYARQPKSCEHCGKVMMVPPNRYERTRFCSRACKHEVQRHERPLTFHGKRANGGSFKPGANMGPANHMYVAPVSFTCEHCGNVFAVKPWITRNRGYRGRFCSAKCRSEYRHLHESGANNPMWVGGPKTYRGRGWRDARKQVVTEQSGKCADCGLFVGGSLPVHHIRPFREFATAMEANARSNLVGLCQPCHMRAEHQAILQSTGWI